MNLVLRARRVGKTGVGERGVGRRVVAAVRNKGEREGGTCMARGRVVKSTQKSAWV